MGPHSLWMGRGNPLKHASRHLSYRDLIIIYIIIKALITHSDNIGELGVNHQPSWHSQNFPAYSSPNCTFYDFCSCVSNKAQSD